MKFTILSDTLREQLQLVGRVVPSKNNGLAITEFALVEIEGEKISLTTTDLETRLTCNFDLVGKEGDDMTFCVRVKQLLDPIREIPNQMLQIELSDMDYELKCSYNNGFFTFPVIKGDDFPEVKSLEGEGLKVSMPIANFYEGLDYTIYAASYDDVRPILTGIHMDIRPEHFTFVSTNAFLLSYYRHSMLDIDVQERHRFTLQRKSAQLLLQVLDKDDEGTIDFEFFTNYALFKTDSIDLQCRLLEGKYPNYETVIPTENDKFLEADRLQLLAATRRVAVFANKALNLVSFDFSPNELVLKANDMDFSTQAEESLPVSFSAPEARFSFRAEHLIQVLSVMPTDSILMKIGDASRAALIQPIGGEAGVEFVVALMPLVYN